MRPKAVQIAALSLRRKLNDYEDHMHTAFLPCGFTAATRERLRELATYAWMTQERAVSSTDGNKRRTVKGEEPVARAMSF